MNPAAGGLRADVISAAVIDAGLRPLAVGVAERFSVYYDLLSQWNSKLNLTAIRDPEIVLRRHFVECIFCAQSLPEGIGTLLDYGSGGGFPGVPVALCRPEIRVTLAESQGKKASFLREVVRRISLKADVYAGRVEAMEAGRVFDAVTLRAVDRMGVAMVAASRRVSKEGWLVVMTTDGSREEVEGAAASEFDFSHAAISGSGQSVLAMGRRCIVPRGTAAD